MTLEFQKKYLRFTAIIIGSFGPVFFLGSMLSFSKPASLTLDLLSWPIDGSQNFSAPTTRFLSALTGGFLTGWGISIWFLQKYVFDKAPEEVRKSVVAGLVAWFILDSLGSYFSGNVSNLFFNCIVLAIAVGPLWKSNLSVESK